MSPDLYLSDEDQDMLLAWAAPRCGLGNASWPTESEALAVYSRKSGSLLAVMVTCETYDGMIDLHFASDKSKRWASRDILERLFGYLFLARHARRVQSVVSVRAKHTASLLLRMGFTAEGTLKDAIEVGENALMFSMVKADCDWIKPRRQKKELSNVSKGWIGSQAG